MKDNGYTLIELALVIFLAGLMITFAVPKIRETLLNDSLKSTTRRLIGAVTELRNDAIREQLDYTLHLDVDHNDFWTSSEDMTPEKLAEQEKEAYRFPAGVRIVDILQIGMEKKMEGQIDMKMFKQGYVQPTVLHLRKDDRDATIVFQPFLSNALVYERYVEIGPDGSERK